MMRKYLILLLDDDPAVRDAIKFSLELQGFALKCFVDGQQLLNALPVDNARCLVTNFQMPEMNGLEVIARIKQAGIDMPIILMSGDVSRSLKQRALRAGARFVVEKPLYDDSLVEKLLEVCDSTKVSHSV